MWGRGGDGCQYTFPLTVDSRVPIKCAAPLNLPGHPCPFETPEERHDGLEANFCCVTNALQVMLFGCCDRFCILARRVRRSSPHVLFVSRLTWHSEDLTSPSLQQQVCPQFYAFHGFCFSLILLYLFIYIYLLWCYFFCFPISKYSTSPWSSVRSIWETQCRARLAF